MHRSLLLPCSLLVLGLQAQTPGEAELALALAAYEQGTYDKARQHADSALALNDTLYGAWKLRGDIRQRLQDLDGALDDYGRAMKLREDDARLFVSRGAARITMGNIKGAMKDLDRALELDPDDPDIWYNRACANYMGQDVDRAMKDAQRALKLRPEFPEALFLSGVVKGERYREEAGIAEIEEALRLRPDIPGGTMSLAMLYYETGRYTEAIDLYTRVIDSGADGEAEAYYYRGDCHYNLEDKEKACADWRISDAKGDRDAAFIVRNYCDTDEESIPKKPVRKRKNTVILF